MTALANTESTSAWVATAAFQELLHKMTRDRQISHEDVEALLREGVGGSPTDAPLGEADVLRWLAEEYGLSYSDLTDIDLDKQLISLFPARVLLKEELLPLRRVDGAVEVATSRLFATEGLDTLKTLTGQKLRPVLAPSEAIQREMKKRLGVGADTLDTLGEEDSIQVIEEDEGNVDLDSAAEDASIIKFVNQVLTEAISMRTTDIHLEPFEEEMRIRYRIDGILQEIPVPASIKRFQPAIVSRIKILSHLDIAEKRLPQDGRIKVRLEGTDVDIRVSLIPMLHGEGVVLRLLKLAAGTKGLSNLRMGPREEGMMRQLLTLPHGIVLVTGPTGSGKSTTLYASLNEINDDIRKIITIEDPVEYHMHGINQIQVSEKSGMTFARGLRAILRHDPDVVLIGEIRDAETAKIAVQASLTGHLVFSTLHTNDAPGAPTRLVDMGVEPYLVASALEGILAQRLLRILCPVCRAEDTTQATKTFKTQIGLAQDVPVYKSVGCDQCRRTGFSGRRGIFEMMFVSDKVRELILLSKSAGQLREAARLEGLKTLSEDGWRLVAQGDTTVDEVLRVSKDALRHENAAAS